MRISDLRTPGLSLAVGAIRKFGPNVPPRRRAKFARWPTIHFKIMPIKNAGAMLFHYLLRDGILTDADYPAEWQATTRAPGAAKLKSGSN